MKGRNEAWTARGKDVREAASGVGIEREREGASGEEEQVKATSREVSRGGHRLMYSIFTNHSPTRRP